MKPILISCIPILALAVLPCAAAEQQMALPQTGTTATAPVPEIEIAEAEARVKQALKNSRDPAADRVTVATHATIIILSGTVASDAEVARIRLLAEQAAANIRVSSQIQVDEGSGVAATQKSAQLVRDVQDALRRDGTTANLQLFVSMNADQQILLSGLVPTGQARTAAQRVATSVPGVTRIENRLTVPGE